MKFYRIMSEIRNIKSKIGGNLRDELGEAGINEMFCGFPTRERRYHTWPLFQIFFNQVASGISCSEAIAWGIGEGILPLKTSPKNSAYCNAKGRLPEMPIFKLMKKVGIEIESHVHKNRRIFGRDVKVVDGTSVQLPDTEANQREYPQPDAQKPGCGQPHMKACALMGLGTGTIIDCVVDAYKVSERTMFRKLWRSLNAGDIVLGDRGFGSYAEVASLLNMGVDFVFRQKNECLETKGSRKIGKDEWIVTWRRPQKPGDWIVAEELPERMEVRAVRLRSEGKKNRSGDIILFTSLTDRKKYPRKKLLKLYYRRWEMELRFRDIKTTMQLGLLRSKTPSVCRKDFWMGLLAYNLIRGIMLNAALRARLCVSRISFKVALKCFDAFFNGRFSEKDPQRAYLIFLDFLAKAAVPERPGRIEPRKIKKRHNGFSLLTTPRKVARTEVLCA